MFMFLIFSLITLSFICLFFVCYFFFIDFLLNFIKFISYHRLVVSYYFLNILIFFVGLNGVLHFNSMTVVDFMNDFNEFKVLYAVFKTELLPEIFPNLYK